MRHLTWLLLWSGISAVLVAQSPSLTPPAETTPAAPVVLLHAVPVPARQLTLKIGVDRVEAAPAQPLVLVADITPQARIHVYAPGATGYLPVELTVDSPSITLEGPALYPPSAHKFLDAVNESADVYDGHFQIRQPVTLTAAPEHSAGTPLTISGVLKYQACNDSVCFRPETVKLTWTVPVMD